MIKKAPHLILIIKVKSSLLSRFLVTLERAWSLATLDTVNLPCWKSLITLALNTHTHTHGVSHSLLPCSLPLLPVFPLPLSYLLVVPQHRDSDDLTIMGARVLSRFSHVRHFATLWTTACQTPLSMACSRQEYWSGLLCPSPGGSPNPGIKPATLMSPALHWQAGSLLLAPPGKPMTIIGWLWTWNVINRYNSVLADCCLAEHELSVANIFWIFSRAPRFLCKLSWFLRLPTSLKKKKCLCWKMPEFTLWAISLQPSSRIFG